MDVAGDLSPAVVVVLLADRGGGIVGVPGPLGAWRSGLDRDIARDLQELGLLAVSGGGDNLDAERTG